MILPDEIGSQHEPVEPLAIFNSRHDVARMRRVASTGKPERDAQGVHAGDVDHGSRHGDRRTELKPAASRDGRASHASDGRDRPASGDYDQIEAVGIAAELAARRRDAGYLGACVIAGAAQPFGSHRDLPFVGAGRVSAARDSEVLQLREELMEDALQPTRIVRPRPCRSGPMERTRDRVLGGLRGHFYYRVTIIA